MTWNCLQMDVEPQINREKGELIDFLMKFKNTDTLRQLIRQRVFGPGECSRIKIFVEKHLKLKKTELKKLRFQ